MVRAGGRVWICAECGENAGNAGNVETRARNTDIDTGDIHSVQRRRIQASTPW